MRFKLSWTKITASLSLAYCTVSYIFRTYPPSNVCVNKQSKILLNNEIIAHRGGCNEVPENTLTAIKHAIKYADICEIDIQFTKDNIPVLFHDKYLNRLIQGYDNKETTCISDLNWNDVMELRIQNSTEYIQDTFYSKMQHRSKVSGTWGNDEYIPRLEDILKYLTGNECHKQINLIFDLQEAGNDQRNLKTFVDLIIKYNYMDKCILFDDIEDRIQFIHNNYKQHKMETVMPMHNSIRMMLLYSFGLLPFIPYKTYPIVAVCSCAIIENYLPSSIVWLYNNWILTPKFINHLKNRGFKVYFMTVDVESQMKHCFYRMQFDGILTDCPQLLNSVS